MNTAQQNQPLIMDAERRAVGLHATWEIAAITNHLIEFADQLAGDKTYSDMTGKELVLRTLAVRVKDLNECLLALLDEVGLGGKPVTDAMLRADIDAGAPVNADGSLNLVHYAAWLVKEMSAGGD